MKKKEKIVCNGCGFPRIIVNKKYGLCNVCNHTRLKVKDTDHKKLSLKAEFELQNRGNILIQVNRKPIKKKSAGQIVRERKYAEVRERKRTFQKEKGIYRCFFCNTELNDDKADCHHALGRDGDLMAEWANLFFAHRLCHDDFHHKTVDYLLQTKWYQKFLERLKKYNHDVYNQELRRLERGGVLTSEQFLSMYIPKKVD